MYACVYINWLKECITYIILKIDDNQIFPAKRYQQYFHVQKIFLDALVSSLAII